MSEIFHHPVSIQGTAYFASDFHFGAPTPSISKERERLVVAWLDEIKKDADYLFLLGDIFDFWFEYKDVVPRGYFRFFAKLQELNEQGIIIYYFTGNHDMWVKNYLANELGVKVFYAQQSFLINGKKCMVGHGDGLDTKDKGYLLIKKIFVFRPNQLLYGAL
ncbi:MAG: UDP-2,3-diacylglucosamine diphosphatase, partial [Bacteroidales bacterium]|nr:UDP-2,3-diacylglucosamine diphosphatase [Bacteroidales bacterium]